jgi:hypothetical protein
MGVSQVEPAHGWESARARTSRLRQLLDTTAPAGFAREQRIYAAIAQSSGLQSVPRAPAPRQRSTGRIPATVRGGRPWLEAPASEDGSASEGDSASEDGGATESGSGTESGTESESDE